MKIFKDVQFIDKNYYYTNDVYIKKGYVIALCRSPHTIIKNEDFKKDESGWFPYIILCKPSWRIPIKLTGYTIFANTPCLAYSFSYTLYEDENTIVKFPNSFIPDGYFLKDNKRDVYLNFYNMTGKIDPYKNKNRWSRGGFSYCESRRLLINCEKKNMPAFFKYIMMLDHSVSYDLEYSEYSATSKKEGKISPIDYILNKNNIKKFKLKKIFKQ